MMPGAGLRTHSTFRVRYAETDQMGFAHHRHYLVWCEQGRTDFIRELGGSYGRLEREGLLLAVAEAQLRYVAPARFEDLVRVDTWLARVQSRSLTFAYEISRLEPGPEQRLATAAIKLVSLRPDGTLCSLPPELLRLFHDAAPTEA